MKFSNKKVQAENKYLRAIQQDFIDNHGRKGNIITLESTKSGNGSFIFALSKDKKVILNKEYKFGSDEYVYTFPSGWIEKGLTGEENVKQELKEEAGYTSNKNPIYLGKVIQNGYITGYNELYFLDDCYKIGEQNTHEGEDIENNVFTLEEFHNMVLENKILDPYTIVCYFLIKEKTNNFTNFNILTF